MPKWLENMHLHAERAIGEEEEEGMRTETFLALCTTLRPIYDTIFPRVVSHFLLKDLDNGVHVVRKEGGGEDRVRDMVDQDLLARGHHKCREDTVNATKSLLWLKRMLHFMEHILSSLQAEGEGIDIVQQGTREQITSLAKEAYDTVLSPYHSLSSRILFRSVLPTVPGKEEIVSLLGLEEEHRPLLGETASLLKRCHQAVHSLLEERGANFPDKI